MAGSPNIVNGKFISNWQLILQKLETEGRVTHLSKEVSAQIDNDLAQSFMLIKADSERRQRLSWAYIRFKGW